MRSARQKLPVEKRDKCPYCGRPRDYDDGHGRPVCPRQGCAGQHSGWNKPAGQPK